MLRLATFMPPPRLLCRPCLYALRATGTALRPAAGNSASRRNLASIETGSLFKHCILQIQPSPLNQRGVTHIVRGALTSLFSHSADAAFSLRCIYASPYRRIRERLSARSKAIQRIKNILAPEQTPYGQHTRKNAVLLVLIRRDLPASWRLTSAAQRETIFLPIPNLSLPGSTEKIRGQYALLDIQKRTRMFFSGRPGKVAEANNGMGRRPQLSGAQFHA